MIRQTLTALLLALCATAPAQQPTIEDSLTWGNVTQQQVEQFVTLAANGHSTAQYYVGRCYFNGYHLPKDKHKAVEAFGKAAEKDQSEALYFLGYCYRFGFGVRKDEARATQLFQRAIKWFEEEIEDNNYAPYYLAMCYNYGFGVTADPAQSIKYYEKVKTERRSP